MITAGKYQDNWTVSCPPIRACVVISFCKIHSFLSFYWDCWAMQWILQSKIFSFSHLQGALFVVWHGNLLQSHESIPLRCWPSLCSDINQEEEWIYRRNTNHISFLFFWVTEFIDTIHFHLQATQKGIARQADTEAECLLAEKHLGRCSQPSWDIPSPVKCKWLHSQNKRKNLKLDIVSLV